MTAQLRSELLKIRSTRTTLGLTLGMVALIAFITLVASYTEDELTLSRGTDQLDLLGISSFGGAFAAFVGVMAVTSEFRHGTIRPTFLAEPRRALVIAVKGVAGALAGLVLGIIAVGLTFGLMTLAFATRGISFALDGGDVAVLLLGTIAGAALWGALGAGLGAIVRSQVGALIGLAVWVLLAEHILFGLVPSVGRFLPGIASDAFRGATTNDLLSPLAGGLLFLAYALVAAVAGALVTERRDVE
jgi:ABC-type transport system involved in multi-copper enzyme maturation permease subunit